MGLSHPGPLGSSSAKAGVYEPGEGDIATVTGYTPSRCEYLTASLDTADTYRPSVEWTEGMKGLGSRVEPTARLVSVKIDPLSFFFKEYTNNTLIPAFDQKDKIGSLGRGPHRL